jgi:zinc transport system substrate-binding protein
MNKLAAFATKAAATAAVTLSLVFAGAAQAEVRVVTSVRPLHSLVSGVVGDRGKVHLIIKGMASPHDTALRPSDAAALQQAQAVFWIGPELETFLGSSLAQIGERVRVIALGSVAGIRQLSFRQGDDWSRDSHSTTTGSGDAHNGLSHSGRDPHIWLDPDNAKVIVTTVAQVLSEVAPADTPYFRQNAAAMMARLDRLRAELDRRLKALRGRRYVVFHDAYQHFERRFAVPATAAISLGDGRLPGAQRIAQVRRQIRAQHVVCVFSEPQFAPRLVETIIQSTGARAGVLDPIGTALPAGSELYFKLMRNIAASLERCLLGGG